MGRMHAQTCRYVGAFVSRLACLLRSSFARETEMKPAAGGRERPGRSLHTHSVSLKHQIGVPRSILPSESGHRSSPRRARQRQHEHRTAMRHVVVHVAFFRTSCARGGGRASALKAGVESRPLSPSRTSRRRSSPTCTSRAPRGGPPRGARSRECCRFHVRWFFPGRWGQTQLYKRGHKTARGRAQSCLCGWHARAYGRRARYRQSSARKRRENGVMRGTLSTACLLVPFDTKAAS